MKVGDTVIVVAWPGARELIGKQGKIRALGTIFISVLLYGELQIVLFQANELKVYPDALTQLALQAK